MLSQHAQYNTDNMWKQDVPTACAQGSARRSATQDCLPDCAHSSTSKKTVQNDAWAHCCGHYVGRCPLAPVALTSAIFATCNTTSVRRM